MANHKKTKTTEIRFLHDYLLDQAILKVLAEHVTLTPETLFKTLQPQVEFTIDQLFARLELLQAAGVSLEFDQTSIQLNKPVDSLQHRQLIAELDEQNRDKLVCIHLASILPSTNQFSLNLPIESADRRLCVTEYQTAGRGRRGRTWSAGYASSLCFSISWSIAADEQYFPLISLLPAVVIAEVLREQAWPIELKWPNDLLLDGKKLCGILIENRPYLDGAGQQRMGLVIGIGINVYASDELKKQVDQPWVALDQFQHPQSRTTLLALIVNRLISELDQVEQKGLGDLVERWSRFDAFRDQPVQVITEQQTHTGIARGLDASGALQVEVNKRIIQFTAGEVSLRPLNKNQQR